MKKGLGPNEEGIPSKRTKGEGETVNIRQKKKRNKIIEKRIQFFNKHMIYSGRMNGKTVFYNTITKACYSKKYKLFNKFKKFYSKIFISVDLGNGKDYTAKTTFKVLDRIIRILSTEIINGTGIDQPKGIQSEL